MDWYTRGFVDSRSASAIFFSSTPARRCPVSAAGSYELGLDCSHLHRWVRLRFDILLSTIARLPTTLYGHAILQANAGKHAVKFSHHGAYRCCRDII